MWGYEADVVPQSLHAALPSPIEAAECGLSTISFFQELVAEARRGVLYSTVCFCIIESGDCLQPETGHSWEATCRSDESIYHSGAKASSRGTLGGLDQIETEQWKRFLCLNLLSCRCTIIQYMLTYRKCAYYISHLYARAHTQNTHTRSLPWRPSLDKRKTTLSRAAVQLFSVVKHVSVWQSKLLFRFAVPDTDRAFKIWGEASRHCSDAARDTGSYLPHCVCLCLQMTLRMPVCCVFVCR